MGNIYNLDCSGLVCPKPVAETKKVLLDMKTGDILEVSGDFYEAGENIKRYAEKHGAQVIEFFSEGEAYCLKIEKL
ncbi:MAG: sulfurtransferase TusA family protein [Promethearchaeota archaeon]